MDSGHERRLRLLSCPGIRVTLRFYTGRDILRFEAIPREDIDTVIAYLEARGHAVDLVGDPFEIEMFRQRFTGTDAAMRSAAPLKPISEDLSSIG